MQVDDDVQLPHRVVVTKSTVERDDVQVGICHFGVGVFHRAHLAYYMDVLLNEHGVKDWGICGIGVRESSRRLSRQLTDQECLYTLVTKGHQEEKTEVRIVRSLVRSLCAPDDPDAVRQQLADPTTRIVSMTITEPGYDLDGNQMVKLDFMATQDEFDPPHSVWGWIVQAIEDRRVAGTPPFTVMSCDNLQHNGDKTKDCLLMFARESVAFRDNAELITYIQEKVSCPNSMVDRITPATTEEHQDEVEKSYGIHDALPVMAESWTQWVVTDTPDSFPSGRPPLHLLAKSPFNVLLVPDVTPYELMKTRLLNGSHLVISYLGHLCGYKYVFEVLQDADFNAFLTRFMDDEVTPTLLPVPGIQLDEYKVKLRKRFGNPHCRDLVLRVGRQGATKAPKFLLPTIRAQLEAGRPVKCATLAVAAWLRFLNHHDEEGKDFNVEDSKAESMGLIQAAEQAGEDAAAIMKKAKPLFEELVDNEQFTQQVQEALHSLYEVGAKATLHRWVEEMH